MANMCTVDVTVTGPKDVLNKLYQTMRKVARGNRYETWYGDLIKELGGNPSKYECRGGSYNLKNYGDTLFWSDESKWCVQYDVFYFLAEKIPGIDIAFTAEEPGCGYFVTNKPNGPNYLFATDEEWEYFDTPEELLDYAKEIFEKEFGSIEELNDALDARSDETGEYFLIAEFEHVDSICST